MHTEQGVNRHAKWWQSDWALIGIFAAFKVLLNGAYIRQYGFQLDELYFIACGRHPSFGYVDHGPMVPWLARLSQALFGESLAALRVFPLISGALSVVLAGLLARELGGKRWAQGLACAAMIASPAFLRVHGILHIPTFEMIYWTACFLILARIVNGGSERLWLLFGFFAGLGLLNKPTMLFFGTGVAVALVLTPLRAHLRRPWVYTGGAIALLIFLPNVIWQYQHDWATYRFVKQLNVDQMQDVGLIEFMLGQLLYMGPLNAFIWGPGLAYLLFAKRGSTYRAHGVICVTVFVILIVLKSKVYYLAPAYPVLYAAGAVLLDRVTLNRRGARGAVMALPVVGLVWLAPLGLPMLPIDDAPRILSKLTGGVLGEEDARAVTDDWRDQHGWEKQVATIARVYESLAPEEQAQCIIVAADYGQAAAIDFFGRKYNLPPAICPELSYFYWGPGTRSGNIAIVYGIPPRYEKEYFDYIETYEGFSRDRLEHLYTEERHVATIVSEHASESETNLKVFLCKGLQTPLPELWKQLKPIGF